MKQYEVEISEKRNFGRYGKMVYTSFCLQHTSKEGVKDFALEILSGMTWGELLNSCLEKSVNRLKFIIEYGRYDLNEVIGLDHASKHFSFSATVMRKGIDYV